MLEIPAARLHGPLAKEVERFAVKINETLGKLRELLQEARQPGANDAEIVRHLSNLSDVRTFNAAIVNWYTTKDTRIQYLTSVRTSTVGTVSAGKWDDLCEVIMPRYYHWRRLEHMRAYCAMHMNAIAVKTPLISIAFDDALEIPGLLENYTA